jgi:4-aminobutyrate aminotransferase-like enzyme
MATALATIEYIEENNLVENAAVQGGRLRDKLDEFAAEFDFIGEVRGMGLMQGVEIVKPGTDKEPDAARTNALMDAARNNGLLIGKGGLMGNVLRIAPHLNVSAEDIDRGANILAKAMTQV